MDTTIDVVLLEIYEPWRVWRGCQLSGYQFQSPPFLLSWINRDPIDTNTRYDVTTAFPKLKPNIDVFPPPRRTRKQRGWYQLMPPRSVHIAAPSIPHVQPAAIQGGGALPAELIQNIVDNLSFVSYAGGRRGSLCACALVCKYWAHVLQQRIFFKIELHSASEFAQLMEFMNSPHSRVREYVRSIELALSVAAPLQGPPFLHLLHNTPLHNPLLESLNLTLSGPLPSGTRSPRVRSVHWLLPRPLPHSAAPRITYMLLVDIRFAAFDDLARLVWELPALRTLYTRRVSWEGKAVPGAWLKRRLMGAGTATRRTPEWHRHVQFTACKAYWPMLWLDHAVSPSFGSHLQALAEFLEVVESCLANLDVEAANLNLPSQTIQWKSQGKEFLFVKWTEPRDTQAGHPGSQGLRIALDIRNHGMEQTKRLDWPTIDAALARYHMDAGKEVILPRKRDVEEYLRHDQEFDDKAREVLTTWHFTTPTP